MDHARRIRYNQPDAPIAQMDRAPDFESVGRGFESLWARFPLKGSRFAVQARLATPAQIYLPPKTVLAIDPTPLLS